MYCVQNNRIYCSDCNKSYIPNNYSNHLKSRGHIKNVNKKRCCSCDTVIRQDNNHNITCCLDKLSLKSDDDIKIDFSDNHKKTKITIDNLVKSVSKEKNIDKYKNVDPSALLKLFMKNFSWNCADDESFEDAKSFLKELQRVGLHAREESDDWFSYCIMVDKSSNTVCVEDIDPNILCDILQINLGKVDETEMDNIKSEAIINELLRTKTITQKQYSVLYKKIRNC